MKSLVNFSRKTARFRPSADSAKALLTAGSRLLAVLVVAFAGSLVMGIQASAQTWNLTTAQRQAYLQYYAPVILKRGDENNNKQGRDWLTNFDFDQDADFSNNRVNWLNIHQYVNASANGPSAYDRWRIRPTLYTALIEYMEGGSKSLVLLYHVYNAADKDGDEIHDWERVEIVIRGVSGAAGAGGEYVSHVTLTLHKEHHMRRSYDADLNFMQTATGKHVLLWQADESNYDIPNNLGPHAHELHFITTPYSWITGQMNTFGTSAEVYVTSAANKKNLHYAFVPEGSPAAVDAWVAKPLSYTTASGLASRVDNGDKVSWFQVKRLTYELQDLSDIFRTNWQYGPWTVNWLSSLQENILLESPITNEAGQAEVSAGLQVFYTRTRDIGKSGLTDGREGVLSKKWFYGAYSAELNPESYSGTDDFKGYEGLGTDSTGFTRGAASGYYNSHNAFWWQHDFFVHSGAINMDNTREEGIWLRGAWYTAPNGGFDGRWLQLFDDRAGLEPFTVLNLSVAHPSKRCGEPFYVTATATGGQSPYTFTWTNVTAVLSPPYAPVNYAEMTAGQGTVTVQSADGQMRTYNIRVPINCGGGGGGGQIP